jgi:hypothetical protein
MVGRVTDIEHDCRLLTEELFQNRVSNLMYPLCNK